ncbi:hypothetical protein [Adlercreutzia caecimuris]|uniref:hypothetical protein n=1 Tax=Adlercreutzia caecimuris TaxID=671266 RepID=UPI001C3EF635|nr:hypothetical protein [Adlercreutzia caecimuris]
MEGTVYRINFAGAYALGHFRAVGLKLHLGRPETCRELSVTAGQLADLIDCLGIDWEDGGYVSNLLIGRNVLLVDDDGGRPMSIGDPYGNGAVELSEGADGEPSAMMHDDRDAGSDRTCGLNRVLLYDEMGIEGIECDECGWTDIHSWDEALPERCQGCKAKVVG